jgi:pimeloyl-ACP methyl ester carboxylesterase
VTEIIPVFRSPESEAQYYAAYDAVLKQWPVPYEELSISTRFGETHVIASGLKSAAPLALLQPSGCGATIWYRNIEALSRHYRTYAIDTLSEVNKSRLTRLIKNRREFADWMADLLTGLQIEQADIVGNSNGGFLALNTALYLPERVGKIVLISPAATFAQMWNLYWHYSPALSLGLLTGSKGLLLKPYAWLWQGFPKDEYISQLRDITALNGLPRHGPPSVFSDAELRKIHTPVLLLIGDHEVIYNPEGVIRRATRLVAGLQAEIVPNANHNAQYTAPEVVNEMILDFLSDPADI